MFPKALDAAVISHTGAKSAEMAFLINLSRGCLKEQNSAQEVRALKGLLQGTLPGDTTGLLPPEILLCE